MAKAAILERFPLVQQNESATSWLALQVNLLLAPNTIEAYARALEDFLSYLSSVRMPLLEVGREQIAGYIHSLAEKPVQKRKACAADAPVMGLANATIQQRLTVVRLFYDYLMEEGVRQENPLGRGRYTQAHGFGGQRAKGLLPKFKKLPWIPSEGQWARILLAAQGHSFRNRFMLALAYDAALRREELCSLTTADLDPSNRLVRIRAETTKNRKERVVPYSEASAALYRLYLRERKELSLSRGPLFLSASRRNLTAPISIWTWSKVVAGLAGKSGVEQFTTHTPRHLRLTDLARANWDIHEIALFAGHRSVQTTLLYIHLSGRDLKQKLEKSMGSIHASRLEALKGTVL